MSATSYFTVARETELEEVVKGSRFIGFVSSVQNVDAASVKLEEVRATYPDATHHPWAYLIGSEMRSSDDGEPGGTAGRPMLETLQKRELDRVIGVVTRYYGGTKLGAGGLVRAYGGTLAKTLDVAGVAQVKPTVTLLVNVPFAEMDVVHRLLDDWRGLRKGEAGYTAQGLRLEITLFAEDGERLARALTEATRGQVTLSASQPKSKGAAQQTDRP